MKKLTALTLALLLALMALSGCKKQQPAEETTTAANETKPGESTADPSQATTAVPDGTTAAPDTSELDYSKYLDDFGYIEGVRASDIIPEIDYSTIEVYTSDIRKDAENAVSSVISNLTSQYSVEVKDREVKDGDTLSIGYVGRTKDDGVAFDGGSTDATEVTIGVTSYIDGFLPQLIGHKPGETFDIQVTFPNPYPNNTDLSGKDAIFTITIHYIKEAPAFDDDFVKAHWDDIKDFPEATEDMNAEDLKQAFYDYYYDYYISSEVYSAVSKLEMEVEVPEAAMNYVENADNCTYMEQYGVKFTDLLTIYYGYTEAQVKEIFEEEATRELIFQAYYEKAGWQITESEYSEVTGQEDNTATIEKLGKGYIARYAMLERALKELKEKVKFVDDVKE